MAALKTFRSAFNGFNREDVVQYIEYLNNTHAAQLGQLNTELTELRSQPREDTSALKEELNAANARCAQLEEELAQVQAQLTALQNSPARIRADEELEAYRRAERAERMATERVAQLYSRANGVLADATVQVDEAADRFGTMADQFAVHLTQLQTAIAESRSTLQDAAAAMYAVRPIATEE